MASSRRAGTTIAVSWLAYAACYFGRKGFSVSKARISSSLGIGPTTLATIDTGYLAAYALGQFLSGAAGDRIGARRLVAGGLALSAVACALFGSASGALMMTGAFLVNGLAQSTGWPGNTRAVASWTPPARRGAVMGVWATCYQVGGIAATAFATYMMVHHGWRAAFWAPAVILAAVGLLVFLTLREGPHVSAAPPVAGASTASPTGGSRSLLRNRTLLCYGVAFFFIKLIRYSFLFWLPYYLHKAVGLSDEAAGYLSIALEVGGAVGAVVIGVWTDRRQGSRSVVVAAWLAGLALVLLAYATAAPTALWSQFVLIALIGLLIVGPDSLLTGAAAQDAVRPEEAARAAGFVNGVGSLGALVQGYLTVGIEKAFGWSTLLYVFVGLALLSAAALVPTFRRDV
jgi:sugar phosphate permease